MKKVVSILVGVCLMACLSTATFATTDINANFASILTSKGDSNTYIGILDALNFSDAEKALYDEFIKAFTGQGFDSSYQYLGFMRVDSGSNGVFLSFYKIPSNIKIGTTVVAAGRFLTVSANCSVSSISWNTAMSKNEDNSIKRAGINLAQSQTAGGKFLLWGTSRNVIAFNSGNLNLDSSMTTAIVEPLNPTHIGQLGIIDNLSTPEPDPDPPLPPVNPPKPPEIPEGDPTYVPYDTSIWNKFLSYVQGNIGSAVNIGLIIFAAIFGIWLVVKVVKYFTKG